MKKAVVLCLFALLCFTAGAYAENPYSMAATGSLRPNSNALANENTATMPGDPYGVAVYQNFYADPTSPLPVCSPTT